MDSGSTVFIIRKIYGYENKDRGSIYNMGWILVLSRNVLLDGLDHAVEPVSNVFTVCSKHIHTYTQWVLVPGEIS